MIEEISIKADIPILCRQVTTFPTGIKKAFQELIDMLPDGKKRALYAISYMENNKIIYKAAIAGSGAEAIQYGCEAFIVPKGDYIGETMFDWMDNTEAIKNVFMNLIRDPRFDPLFPCVEWYKSDKELLCMAHKKGTPDIGR